jgi:hypothetical protein
MKKFTLGIFLCSLFAILLPGTGNAQTDRNKVTEQKYPSSFLISKTDLQQLLSLKPHSVIDKKANKYLDGGIVMTSTKNGDMQLVRIKLAFFLKAFLNIQVNGTDSTQVFIVSDDKSVFYKGHPEKENWVMIKCEEDEIVSE